MTKRKCRSCPAVLPEHHSIRDGVRCKPCQVKYEAWLEGEDPALYEPQTDGLRALDGDLE